MPTRSWTNPTGNFHPQWLGPHAYSGSHPSSHAYSQPEEIAHTGQQIVGELAQMMEKRRNDAIAQKLLEQERPDLAERYKAAGLTGAAAYQQMNDDVQGEAQDQQQQLAAEMHRAQIAKIQAELATPASLSHDRVMVTLANGQQIPVTGDAALNYEMRTNLQRQRNPAVDPAARALQGSMPIARGWLKPDGTFTNSPRDVGKPDNADASQGDYLQFKTPTGRTLVAPYSYYQEKTGASRYMMGDGANSEPPADNPDPVSSSTQDPGTLPTDSGPPSPSPLMQSPVNTTPAPDNHPPPAAVAHLQAHPELASDFDAKYGQGASAIFLGQ